MTKENYEHKIKILELEKKILELQLELNNQRENITYLPPIRDELDKNNIPYHPGHNWWFDTWYC